METSSFGLFPCIKETIKIFQFRWRLSGQMMKHGWRQLSRRWDHFLGKEQNEFQVFHLWEFRKKTNIWWNIIESNLPNQLKIQVWDSKDSEMTSKLSWKLHFWWRFIVHSACACKPKAFQCHFLMIGYDKRVRPGVRGWLLSDRRDLWMQTLRGCMASHYTCGGSVHLFWWTWGELGLILVNGLFLAIR